jgi:hypothetical protein
MFEDIENQLKHLRTTERKAPHALLQNIVENELGMTNEFKAKIGRGEQDF